ncbi:RrF2 family transcriptional regulator [Oceanicella actignis]|uniref:RrF2 family transcriptional regulator n=1 Tax=Oceanicella actignis TaxID=1189325 RepID=UPI0011E78E45|nr:Rrf2 family transcriptional regulator [Oceanicella actignis]TYO90691.1 BadM/Rrf2 family transcriptional regulator [Oceanicella actignis]
MLKLSRKTVLAIEAVLDVAYNARPDPVQARDITERQGIPQRYLEQVMQRLVRAGVLKGVRGPRGGYALARERRKVTVGDVVRVVSAIDQEAEEPPSRGALGRAVVVPLWDELEEEFLARLDRITMEDLCRRAAQLGVPRAGKDVPDFTI